MVVEGESEYGSGEQKPLQFPYHGQCSVTGARDERKYSQYNSVEGNEGYQTLIIAKLWGK